MDEIKKMTSKRADSEEGLHVMWMGKERIPKKMLHTKMEGKLSRGRPRTRWIYQIRKDIEMREEN